ncbi:MAG: glutamate-1-semialdehyde 2,1-aminomutase [Chloroflexi bacterium]|nr:glutamate-1-semialdehyde 2,1-aminomutase [Chloroflexota bacterium]
MPGGVNSPVRAFAAVGGVPPFMERGEGPCLWDVDGKQYVDYVMSWGPLILGHAFPPVVRAIEAAARCGTSFGAPTAREVRLAELVVGAFSSIETVRFVNSGTEATMSAIRLARAYTGREAIVKFAGNYHGHVDALLAQAGSGSLTLGIPSSPGVPGSTAHWTFVLPYNDSAAVEAVFQERGGDIAAVIVEPIAGNMGVVPPAPGFLETVRRCTSSAGALLILDEVITGFRVALGGAQALLGIQPDLTTLGKVLGGGLPVGAYGGRKQVMDLVSPTGPVYQAGTLSGNPLAMAAGVASLEALRAQDFYSRLAATTDRLASGLRDAAGAADVPVTVNACTGMLTLFFTEGPVTDLRAAQTADTARYARFFHAMLERGIYLPPSQYEAWMLCSQHSPDVVDRTIEAAQAALRAVS